METVCACGELFDADARSGCWMTGSVPYCSHECAKRAAVKELPIVPRFPTDHKTRKGFPITTGVLDYFPDALLAVAAVSKAGNDQHNPGEPLHWARGKSMDQSDTLVRHLMERGEIDTDGHRHSAKMAWRALALLQLEIEEAQKLPPSRGSKEPSDDKCVNSDWCKKCRDPK